MSINDKYIKGLNIDPAKVLLLLTDKKDEK